MNPTTNRIPNLQWDVFEATLELIRSLCLPLNQLATKDAALVTQTAKEAVAQLRGHVQALHGSSIPPAVHLPMPGLDPVGVGATLPRSSRPP
jgi:hypothetical protein